MYLGPAAAAGLDLPLVYLCLVMSSAVPSVQNLYKCEHYTVTCICGLGPAAADLDVPPVYLCLVMNSAVQVYRTYISVYTTQ